MSHAFKLLQVLHDFAIRELSIFALHEDFVELGFKFENHLNTTRILYRDKEDDTLIEVTEYNKRLVKDKNYIDVACEDLLNILSEAKFVENLHLQNFYGNYDEDAVLAVNRVYEQFKIHSKTTKNAINVHSLDLQIENVSHLHSVLTYFNPTNLKELSIFKFEPTEDVFDFGSIVEMDHWKNSKKIELYGFFVNISFENFSHCECVKIEVSTFSADDVQTLVNIVSNSPSLRYFHIEYDDLNEHVTEQFLDILIGEKQTNQSGKQVRLIQNEIIFVHDPDRKKIYTYNFSDKKDETSKALTSLPSKFAMLCLSNRLIMEKIVQHFDFAELIALRRVSRGIQNCIDFLKPDPKLVAVKITLEPVFICVEVFGRNTKRKILYEAPGTEIPATSSSLHINHKADINNLSDDLVQLFKDQKTVLKELRVIWHPSQIWMSDVMGNIYRTVPEEQFVDIFKKAHSLRGSVFLVEKLNLTATRLTRATKILENLDPVAIKIIELRTMNFGYDVLSLNNITSLEQWTSANELKIEIFFVECDLEKLVHFSKVAVRLKSISIEDVLYLKEKTMSYAFKLLETTNYSAIRELTIFAENEDYVELRFRFENHLNEARLTYINKEDDTLIEKTKYNNRLVEDKNYIDVMCKDLLHILSETKFAEDLKIQIIYGICDGDEKVEEAVNRVYEQFKIYSQTTKNGINVRSLHLRFLNVSQLRSVLLYFNPNKLEELTISNWEPFEEIFDFESIVKMDHWKNSKKIVLHEFSVSIPFENFSHCEDATVRVSRISEDDIRTIVNVFSNSPCLKNFCVKYYSLNKHVIEHILNSVIGEKQINKTGEQVRLIGNKIKIVHNFDVDIIFMSEFPKKKDDESIENLEDANCPSSKPATLCFCNDLIIEKIVQHFDFAELVVLRRVSRGSRHCVDLLKPDPKLVAMQIYVEPGFIFVEVFGRNNNRTILYKDPGTDRRATTKFFSPTHITDINNLSDDLVQLLKDQKTALKELYVDLDSTCRLDFRSKDWELTVEQFIEMFTETYSLRGSVFPVEKLNLKITCLKKAARILQNLDPLSLKTIKIRPMTQWVMTIVPQIGELVCLEHWWSARELKIVHFREECDIEKFIHFSTVDIWLKSISMGEILYLKEKFLSSPDFRQFKTKFVKTDVDDTIFEENFLGAPFRRVDDISLGLPDVWFFPYKNSMENLQILYYRKAKEFMFKRVSRG